MVRISICVLSLALLVSAVDQTAAAGQHGYGGSNQEEKRASLPAFQKGEPYSTLRKRLLNSGWKAARTADADQCEKGDSRCEGRGEMQECAGTAEANCNFRWRKAIVVIDVNTIKDVPIVTTVSRCRYQCR
jgi:hypothetical protein